MIPYINEITFYSLAAIVIILAILVIESKKIMHAALYLGALLVTIGEIYFVLHAEFLGVIQFVVYAGGITIVMLFALMMATPEDEQLRFRWRIQNLVLVLIVIFLSVSFFATYTSISVSDIPLFTSTVLNAFASYVFTQYSVLILILTILLFSVLLSSTHLAGRREE
ncbi:MAG: NADH-quinone oxidoreductase subunit J [Candidatus Odinarchaeota archaeon]|nr:NADH-quinone oxidoreductase subunit J [Candidatus Odinarchaeota archaeon]